MATSEEYAQWIVDNQDKQGTPEFETVAKAYELSKQTSVSTSSASPISTRPAAPGQVIGTGPVAPDTVAPQFYPTAPAGYNVEAIKQTLEPIAEHGKTLFKGYGAQPSKALIDVAATHFGFPPPYATTEGAKALYDTYKAAGTSLNKAQSLASKIAESPAVEATFGRMLDTLPKDEALRLKELVDKRGAQGLKEFIDTAPEALRTNPEFVAASKELSGQVPSRFAQIGRVFGPVARTLGKVAGPAGTALNIYEAQEFAKESQLGERLAQGQGQVAQRQFRNMNVPYGEDFIKTITPDQAKTILSSKNERDIQAFGGRTRLEQIAGQ